MSDQIHPYDPRLASRFMSLALAAEAKTSRWPWDWRADDQDPFDIPLELYERLFLSGEHKPDEVKAEVDGPIQEEYAYVGAIRVGHQPVADWGEAVVEYPSLRDVDGFDDAVRLFRDYRRRWAENIGNTVRYSRSNAQMGFALRSRVDGHGVIVLRGTMNVDEWITNLNYRLTPFLPDSRELGMVHRGFRNIYKGLRGRYRELAVEFGTDRPLYLVGHSLGAAVSQLAALDLVHRRPERTAHVRVYGFASPRVGDATFASSYDALVGTSYRVVNVCDVVPYVPFEEAGTVADALGFPYADTKGEMSFAHQAGNPIANHIVSYHLATKHGVPGPMDLTVPRRLG